MAFNEKLADRIREFLVRTHPDSEEMRMFGGLCFMVDDKMCVGIVKDSLMVRLNPEKMEEVLERDGCRPMDFNGKTMKGFVYVDPEALTTDQNLKYWMEQALEYNKVAKASKKKKGK